MQPDLYRTLATYNQWANTLTYTACAQLTPADYHRDRRAFFTSIHGTLNHLLLTDHIWLGRFQNAPYPFHTLADELYSTFAGLQRARQDQDAAISAYTDSLTQETILSPLTYRNSSDREFTQPLWQCLTHWFNYQTHHRGQVHQMLVEYGMATPVLDMVAMLRQDNRQ